MTASSRRRQTPQHPEAAASISAVRPSASNFCKKNIFEIGKGRGIRVVLKEVERQLKMHTSKVGRKHIKSATRELAAMK
jgi:hypothetical protein